MSSTVILSKNMPQKFNIADGGNSFILGRKAFFNNIHETHKILNLGNNNSSTNSLKINRLTTESGNNPKPLPNTASDLRTQRLRLSTIGSGSIKLKNNNDKISFKQEDHYNVVNNAKKRVKGGGAANVPKRNSIPISSV